MRWWGFPSWIRHVNKLASNSANQCFDSRESKFCRQSQTSDGLVGDCVCKSFFACIILEVRH